MGDSTSWSDVKPATPEIQHICDQVKSQAVEKIGHKCSPYEATLYRDQGSAEKNYSIKIFVGNTEYAHLHAMKILKAEFLEVLYPKTEEDPLETF